jgi:RND family efflux transporter MFP subunit
MNRTGRSALAGFAATALVLLGLAPWSAGGDPPPKKAPPQRRGVDLEGFRSLDPAARLKLVEVLAGEKSPFVATARGDLTAAVVERGAVESADAVDVVCRVKARAKDRPAATVKWLIDDGAAVKKGDRIAQLDDSELRDLLNAATVKVQEADALLEQANEDVQTVRHENEIEVKLAEIEVKLLQLELKDALRGKAREALELKVEQAKLKHDRATLALKKQVKQAEAEKRAKAAARELAVQRLRAVEADLKECEVLAPSDGVVVHFVTDAGRFGRAGLAPGEPVREGQRLLRVSPLKKFDLETRIHEAQVSAIRVGEPAEVRIDALPNLVLRGKVTRVSPVAASDWRAADVKVYPVTVSIDDPPPALKPGMTGEVQIAAGERKGVLQVPRTAVVTAGRDRVCFVKAGPECQERKVVVGLGNATAVEVRAGLKEGEAVVADPAALLSRK